jgi:glycosyltransferase involved in cell wall biosynthesis
MRRAYEDRSIRIRVEPSLAAQGASPKAYRDAIAYLSGLIETGAYDVVHANTLQTYWAVEAARAANTASVWSVHESERWQSYYDDLPRDVAAAALACFSYPYRVVFSATSTARRFTALNSVDNFGLIRFPLDSSRFRSELARIDRTSARQELGIDADDFCVLIVGTVCERKGQHDLVYAFRSLPAVVAARTTCLVIGARDSLAYSRKLEELARALPLDRRHRFRVIKETGETAPYWRAADVFCCTSRVESYPQVILEAMAAGLPVITTPVFGIAEQVRPSINALMFKPGDIGALRQHLHVLATDDRKRRDFALASPSVLASLPGDVDVDQRYIRLFRSAAESSLRTPIGASRDPFLTTNRRAIRTDQAQRPTGEHPMRPARSSNPPTVIHVK